MMPESKPIKFKNHHYEMLHRRGLKVKNYTLIKETYTSLYLRDKRDGSVKILTKHHL